MSRIEEGVAGLKQRLFAWYEAYKKSIRPEKEFAFFSVALYFYLKLAAEPELFFEYQPMLAAFYDEVELAATGRLAAVLSFYGLVHGSKRVVFERLPYLKAYINVFILNRRYDQD